MSNVSMMMGMAAGSSVAEYIGGALSPAVVNGGSATVDLSGVDINAGDLIIGVHAVGEDADQRANMSITSTGYTLISSLYGNDTYDVNLEVYAKIADGTEADFVTAGGLITTASVIAAARVYRGPAVIPTDASSGLYAEASVSNADDITWPEVTGTETNEILVYIGATGHVTFGGPTYTDPTDLTDFESLGADDSEDLTFGIGNKVIDSETSFSANIWYVNSDGTASAHAYVILKLSV